MGCVSVFGENFPFIDSVQFGIVHICEVEINDISISIRILINVNQTAPHRFIGNHRIVVDREKRNSYQHDVGEQTIGYGDVEINGARIVGLGNQGKVSISGNKRIVIACKKCECESVTFGIRYILVQIMASEINVLVTALGDDFRAERRRFVGIQWLDADHLGIGCPTSIGHLYSEGVANSGFKVIVGSILEAQSTI